MSEAISHPGDAQTAVWFVNAAACAGALAAIDGDLGLVPAADHDRIMATTPETLREARLTAHRALRLVLTSMFGPEWRSITFSAVPHGKPALPGLPGDFSLSHSGGASLVGVTRSRTIGVDLERPRAVRLSASRSIRIVNAAVMLARGAALSGEGDARTLNAWVRLEALAKAEGCGMARLLTRTGVLGGAPSPDAVSATQQTLRVEDVVLPGGYVGAVSVTVGHAALPVVQVMPSDAAALQAMLNGAWY